MPFYAKCGEVPHKRHTQFRRADGELYTEEVMGMEGFSGIQSLLYHHYPPTSVSKVDTLKSEQIEWLDYGPLRGRQFKTKDFPAGGDPLESRRTLMGNSDVTLGLSRPTESSKVFYRNGQAYEVWYCHEGKGELQSQFGVNKFRPGDYIVIPYGVTWRMELEGESRFLVIECPSQIAPPKRYRNKYGQLLEHSPYCERDITPPEFTDPIIERGDFEVHVKVRDALHLHVMTHHPFDVVGWDGYLYPWTFNIEDFEPITGRVHQPPPVHQTFEAHNFVVCSFCPRIFDYHPLAIPAPYNHSNVNSDEVLYYVDGDFMSRRGVDKYDWTLHPSGLPHGPQPGATEASIGKETTEELAVMVDTFRPLQVAKGSVEFEDEGYAYSWSIGAS